MIVKAGVIHSHFDPIDNRRLWIRFNQIPILVDRCGNGSGPEKVGEDDKDSIIGKMTGGAYPGYHRIKKGATPKCEDVRTSDQIPAKRLDGNWEGGY